LFLNVIFRVKLSDSLYSDVHAALCLLVAGFAPYLTVKILVHCEH